MKNFVLLFVLFFLNALVLEATHNRAGEITFTQLSALNFEITVTTYTKASSLQADRDSLEVHFGDGSSEWVPRNNGVNNQGVLVGNDIKKNTYVTTHIYSSTGNYVVSMTDPNRNGGILNVNYPSSNQMPFHIETQLTILSNGTNNSPMLLQAPIDLGCTNQVFKHNPIAFDAEGDSLVFEMRVPLQGTGSVVANYQWPDNVGGGNQTLTLHGSTGQLVWDSPVQAGEYNIAFSIKEYRNGLLISEIIRDMQITINSCGNRPPQITINSPTMVVEAKDTITIPISVSDLDGDMVTLSALGGPMLQDGSFAQPAEIAINNNNTNNPTATLTWETDCDHRQYQPYLIVFRAEDDFDINGDPNSGVDYQALTVLITNNSVVPCPPLSNVTSIDGTLKEIKVFPNPTRDVINIEMELDRKEEISIQLVNLMGQVISTKHTSHFLINEQINVSDLAQGIYFLNIRIGNKMITRKVVVDQ